MRIPPILIHFSDASNKIPSQSLIA
jgi:hypothetical protein